MSNEITFLFYSMTLLVANIITAEEYESHFKMDVKRIGWDIAEPTGKTIIE
jgi:hypothetical protein